MVEKRSCKDEIPVLDATVGDFGLGPTPTS